MTPISATLWPELSRLLDQALDLPSTERTTWLERLRRDQPDLAPALMALLEAHARRETDDFLERGPVVADEHDFADDDDPSESLQPGSAIGPYRLLRPLGQGGMAVVWLAERSDGTLARQVALKLPQRFVWRPGLAERFTRERDILARLEHPHIARLYDAGISATDGPGGGLPYLVLEHVQGLHLGAYCDGRHLGTTARLALMAQVLDAVRFAHAQLVIHRDLKPANILVTDAGEVRLLDFGVAKLLADDSTGTAEPATELTRRAGRALTPEYASPEQVRGEALSTASDVYSLGVVLYELLSGQRPYRLHHRSAAQLEQAIVDVDPAPPSSRVTRDAAALRGTTRARLARELRGELDTIVLKALKKRPAERYGTVAELAEDLRRHRSGEPVLARPDSRLYRLRRFVGRNRLAVGASTAVALSLVTASGLSIWQARIAQQQAQRALAVQAFMTDIFRTNSVDQRDPLKARQTTARELLDVGAKRIDEHLRNDPEGRAEILSLLGEMYFDLGLDNDVAAMRERRVKALKEAHGDRDRRVALALASFAKTIDNLGRDDEQRAALDEAKKILDELGDTTSEARAGLLEAMAKAYALDGARTLALAEQAVDIYRKHHPEAPALASALSRLAIARTGANDLAGAEAAFAESLERLMRTPQTKGSMIIVGHLMLAGAQARQHKVAAAEATYRKTMAATLERNGQRHTDTLYTQAWFGWFLHRTSRRDEAWQLLRSAQATAAEHDYGFFFSQLVKLHVVYALGAEGAWEEARPLLDQLVPEFRKVKGGRTWVLPNLLRLQAEQRQAQGDAAGARQALDEAWSRQALLAPEEQRSIHGLVLTTARLALVDGDGAAALEALTRMPPPTPGPADGRLPLHPDDTLAQALKARALALAGKPEAAAAEATAVIAALDAAGARAHYQAIEAEAQLALGQAQLALGRVDAAREALERAVALRQGAFGGRSPYVAEAEKALADGRVASHRREPAAAPLASARGRAPAR